jgi:urease accessory protein
MARSAIALLMLVPMACFAHFTLEPHTALHGLLHPLTGLDHLVAMFAVGWLAVRGRGRPGSASIPLAFLAGMFGGFGFGLAGFSAHFAEYGIVLSIVSMGILVALPIESRHFWAFTLVTGLCHGLVHGAEMPASSSTAEYLLGLLASSAALLFLGMHVHRHFSKSAAFPAVRFAVSALLMFAGVYCLVGIA